MIHIQLEKWYSILRRWKRLAPVIMHSYSKVNLIFSKVF